MCRTTQHLALCKGSKPAALLAVVVVAVGGNGNTSAERLGPLHMKR